MWSSLRGEVKLQLIHSPFPPAPTWNSHKSFLERNWIVPPSWVGTLSAWLVLYQHPLCVTWGNSGFAKPFLKQLMAPALLGVCCIFSLKWTVEKMPFFQLVNHRWSLIYIRGVKLIFTRGHISLEVAFKGPNVILGLYKCNYSLIVKWELGAATG